MLEEEKKQNTLLLSIGPVPQEVELFAVGFPAGPKERRAGGHSFINCV